MHFYRLLQVDVFSKRENSLGYIGRQVNSRTGLSIVIFSPAPGEVNNWGRSWDGPNVILLNSQNVMLKSSRLLERTCSFYISLKHNEEAVNWFRHIEKLL